MKIEFEDNDYQVLKDLKNDSKQKNNKNIINFESQEVEKVENKSEDRVKEENHNKFLSLYE